MSALPAKSHGADMAIFLGVETEEGSANTNKGDAVSTNDK